jgi:hypothetical protein
MSSRLGTDRFRDAKRRAAIEIGDDRAAPAGDPLPRDRLADPRSRCGDDRDPILEALAVAHSFYSG